MKFPDWYWFSETDNGVARSYCIKPIKNPIIRFIAKRNAKEISTNKDDDFVALFLTLVIGILTASILTSVLNDYFALLFLVPISVIAYIATWAQIDTNKGKYYYVSNHYSQLSSFKSEYAGLNLSKAEIRSLNLPQHPVAIAAKLAMAGEIDGYHDFVEGLRERVKQMHPPVIPPGQSHNGIDVQEVMQAAIVIHAVPVDKK